MASSFYPLSVVVITLNEEENLPRLLATLPAGVELIVLDSGSTDSTVSIAKARGAVVQTRAFDTYANQKNAAIELASRDWIFSLDADEEPSKELWQEILNSIQTTEAAAWRVRRRLVFLGRPMSYGKTTDAPLRLFRRGQGRFENDIHEEVQLQKVVRLYTTRARMNHYSYRNLHDYFARFNRYTDAVARRHFKAQTKSPSSWVQMLRFFGEFVWRYIIRLGVLDGHSGLVYALLSSTYVFTKYAKLRELEDNKNHRTVV